MPYTTPPKATPTTPPPPPAASVPADPQGWTPKRSADLYGVDRWSLGYFAVNDAGHVEVRPTREPSQGVDLKRLVDELQQRGIQLPVLLRFDELIADRLEQIHAAFSQAIDEYAYEGTHRVVYPVKVNQQRHIIEQVFQSGKAFGYGLEAGSKPELLAVMAEVDNPHTPIICNGFKDDEFIEAVILATKMGKNIIPVVEKFSELEAIIRYAKAHDVRPRIGVRVKLAARGAGRWESSGGVRSKFGLFISEAIKAIETLREADMLPCLRLLHFHLGSQINDIRNIKAAINELTRIYAELRRLGAVGLDMLDVGGGLGVDYDGTKSSSDSSMNYTLQEYANNVVYHVREACEAAEVPHPHIVCECGRAIAAYHSVLVFNVIGRSGFEPEPEAIQQLSPEQLAQKIEPIRTLYESYVELDPAHLREYYHDAQVAMDQVQYLFSLGYCSLADRALAERLYYGLCLRALQMIRTMADPPSDLTDLEGNLADIFFCNFSLFQSVPDSWAIDQLFPIMPLHRLNAEPTRRGILADITCDSDGKVDRFVTDDGTLGGKRMLELHEHIPNEPYYLGIFLVGAYQEILGDLHNLFGDTNAVHIRLDEDGEPCVEEVIEGDRVREVLSYVQYSAEDLMRKMRKRVERALRQKRITLAESNALLRFYESGLEGYTYLE